MGELFGSTRSGPHAIQIDFAGHQDRTRVDRTDVLAANAEGRRVGLVDVHAEPSRKAVSLAKNLQAGDEAARVPVGATGEVLRPSRAGLRHAVEKRVGHEQGARWEMKALEVRPLSETKSPPTGRAHASLTYSTHIENARSYRSGEGGHRQRGRRAFHTVLPVSIQKPVSGRR